MTGGGGEIHLKFFIPQALTFFVPYVDILVVEDLDDVIVDTCDHLERTLVRIFDSVHSFVNNIRFDGSRRRINGRQLRVTVLARVTVPEGMLR